MATLGAMRTRIADELQIDATTYSVDIDRAIFSSIERYNDRDFWFLEASMSTVLFTSTAIYNLTTLLPGRAEIQTLRLELSPGLGTMYLKTQQELLEMDFDENFTGQPAYWTVRNDSLLIRPRPQSTYTAQVWHTLRRSMTASASASSVWTTEAEEMIRLTAEIDLLENRIRDYAAAGVKSNRLAVLMLDIDEKTVARTSKRRTKPFM